jgi:tetratricopeptide (TPR) repeat protein
VGSLADLYIAQKKYAEAEPLLERELAIREKSTMQAGPEMARNLFLLGMAYAADQKYAAAIPMFDRGLKIMGQTLPVDDLNLAPILDLYSAVLRKAGRAAEADETESRAQAIRAKHAESNPPK